ncbi:FAD binding domain-containing protein [Yoonia sp.]|uniref:FAD binding domain-containing protein n=1 Tax=Yoonia sp. TaxID=2212373 RepID=UPI00397608C8
MSTDNLPRKAIIIGGSMAGLFSAIALRKAGWDVEVHERVSVPLSGRGAGIVTHGSLFRALSAMGISVDDSIGVPTTGRVVFDRTGAGTERLELPQILTSWSKMHEIASAALPDALVHRGKTLLRYEETETGVTAHFEDGTSTTGDLLIGADGFRSTVRDQMLPDTPTSYAGYIAWRGMVNEADLSERARAEMFPYFAFCLPEGEQILGYPVAGEGNDMRPGHRRYNFVWYRPADEAVLTDLLTGTDGVTHELSISPLLLRPEKMAEMRQAADNLLSPQFAELISRTETPFIQPIYDLSVTQMTLGRVVLLGDAAFVGRPHCGMGVTKAAEDAVVLAEVMSRSDNSVADALAAFDATRRPVDQYVVEHARALGAYMQAQVLTEEERSAAERHRSPDAVLRETATADFLETV